MKPVHKVAASFGYAFSGIGQTCAEGRNFRIQLAGGVAAVVLGLALRVSAVEWLAIIICCGLVLGGECFNTAIEHAVDLAMPDRHPAAKAAKDEAAGAVLLFSIASLLVGMVIFVPKILDVLGW